MPVTLDPNQTFDVVLKSDQGKSPAPTFHFRHLDGRRWKALATAMDKLPKAESSAAGLDALFDAIRLSLCNWTNMLTMNAEVAKEFGSAVPIPGQAVTLPYDPAKLDLLIRPIDARELLEAVAAGAQPGAETKK